MKSIITDIYVKVWDLVIDTNPFDNLVMRSADSRSFKAYNPSINSGIIVCEDLNGDIGMIRFTCNDEKAIINMSPIKVLGYSGYSDVEIIAKIISESFQTHL